MVQLPYLQPFDDVNKRVSRLTANIPLNRKNLSPLSFTEVPNELYVQGLLGVYELNEIELLKDVFLWAYDRSAKQYAAQRQSLGDPYPFRLKYRDAIRDLVNEIVTEVIPKNNVTELIKNKSVQLPEKDQSRFVEAVETELINLHEGNFARYQIRPSQFKEWKKTWNNWIIITQRLILKFHSYCFYTNLSRNRHMLAEKTTLFNAEIAVIRLGIRRIIGKY